MQQDDPVAKLAGARVVVIGDVMVDHYVYGAVQRISPEAPVPVLNVASERHVLGGAANVAANIAALGGRATLLSIVGSDAAGAQLAAMLNRAPLIEPSLAVADDHPTIVKTRYLGDRQQIVRVDREKRGAYPSEALASLAARIPAAVAAADAVVLSDYGKGVLDDAILAAAIAAARAGGKPIIVDPKRSRFSDYAGATYITPNRRELEAAVDAPAETDAEAEAAARIAMAQSGAAILLTRSEKGMALFRAEHAPVHLSTQAREVFDVSGAGDTVVGAFAAALAAKLSVDFAMTVANCAAGVVVGKLGTAVCTAAELSEALGRLGHHAVDANDEIEGSATWDQAERLRAQWRRDGLSVGFANGCFDLLHPGHVTLLRRAASAVDRLIVAINSDASVSALKGSGRPVQSQDARARVLASVKGVDLVVVFDEPTPRALIERLVPDVLVKGADYREEDVVGGDIVKAAGGRVLLIDLVAGHSTSALVRRANGA